VFEVKMPQWGMNMTEGTILQWLKQLGEPVKKGEPLVEIEIAKAVNTLESPVTGVITKLVANVNDTVPVQGVIAIISQ
jgi:pyruvate/2-oxoglutarate dehydrogenase complex dihydrolipoamide acyltransferase (E2) component